ITATRNGKLISSPRAFLRDISCLWPLTLLVCVFCRARHLARRWPSPGNSPCAMLRTPPGDSLSRGQVQQNDTDASHLRCRTTVRHLLCAEKSAGRRIFQLPSLGRRPPGSSAPHPTPISHSANPWLAGFDPLHRDVLRVSPCDCDIRAIHPDRRCVSQFPRSAVPTAYSPPLWWRGP